jgi:Ca-activated chloride channel family protein
MEPTSSRSIKMSEPTKKSIVPTIVLIALIASGAGIVTIKMFGATVKTKFSEANGHVQHEVRFNGSPGRSSDSYQSPPPEPSAANRRYDYEKAEEAAPAEKPYDYAPAAPAAVAPTPQAEPTAPPHERAEVAVNDVVSTATDRLSTFSIDVDTGAYTSARRALLSGYLPAQDEVRVEEFVNYFNYGYPAPEAEAFAVSMEGAPSPFSAEPNTYLLRVGVQGRELSQAERKPTHLTFLVDVSGSMSGSDRIELVKQSLAVLTKNLRPQDSVALVTYAGSNDLVLAKTAADAKGKAKILAAIQTLGAGGGTAMGSGMDMAYKEAAKSTGKGQISRVIVLSDGDANIGPISQNEIYAAVKSRAEDGITLTTVGVGNGNYNDYLMEQLANKGNGNYYYIDNIKEANRIFGDKIGGTLEVIAKDVKIQVEFNPAMVKSYRLVGYENRAIKDQDFRNDNVDAGEIGSGHTVTALYELTTAPTLGEDMAYVRVRHKQPDGHKASEQTFTLRPVDIKAKLADASADLQFAAAVSMFAERLRGSKYGKALSYDLIREIAAAASSPNQEDRAELLELIDKAKTLDSQNVRFK